MKKPLLPIQLYHRHCVGREPYIAAQLKHMTAHANIKQAILKAIKGQLADRILSTREAIASAMESRDRDTKSSAGDKHETARAMVQIEIEKYEQQLSRLLRTLGELEQINTTDVCRNVQVGSVAITSAGNYYMCAGIGKLEIDGSAYYAISAASPIGALLLGKAAGDSFVFQEKPMHVQDVF